MTEEQRAVALIFEHLHQEGLEWFRLSNAPGVAFYERLKKRYTLLDRGGVDKIRWTAASQFPIRNVAVVVPPTHHPDPLLALWCRWDFSQTPARCGFYVGFWAKIIEDHSFVGFRFESPEDGDQHNYYHCQPCRNLGDRETPEELAVAISERAPTFGLPADNSAELALNVVLAMRGRAGLEKFRRSLLSTMPEARNSPVLQAGFRRLCGLTDGKPSPDAAQAAA
jgi:hypothetical protein